MKVSKLIIPLLSMASINSANKRELLQLEKMPEVSYEVPTVDNWDNFYYLTSANATENLMQQSKVIRLDTQKHGSGKPTQFLTADQCLEIYYRAMAACALLGPFAGPCIALASAALTACLAAGD